MDAGTAKRIAREWVESGQASWPGLRAAHLVGGLATMGEHDEFPPYKDADLHLIFAGGSPVLQVSGPFPDIIETEYAGLLIEAGVKSVCDYSSAEKVLSNPEIAYHLTVDSTLYDPNGLLANLTEPVCEEYPRRRWVRARVEFERAGIDAALGSLQQVRDTFGLSGGFMVIGYSCIYAVAAFSVAALRPPRIGSQMLVHLRDVLTSYDRLELYEDFLSVFGVRNASADEVERWLAEGANLFDEAVRVRHSPHPFQHKLHAHLRPYFVESCRAMLAAGDHRESLAWLAAYYLACCDVLLADGPESSKRDVAARRDQFLDVLGIDGERSLAARLNLARKVHERSFALADEIIAIHPDITD